MLDSEVLTESRSFCSPYADNDCITWKALLSGSSRALQVLFSKGTLRMLIASFGTCS